MSLTLRNGVYHWRKLINGVPLARSTKTGDKKLAEQIAATWESDAIKEIVLAGNKPVQIAKLREEFLAARAGTAGQANARRALDRFKVFENRYAKDITEGEALQVIDQLRTDGLAKSTLSVTINYWNAMMKFGSDRGYTSGPKLPTITNVQGRVRWLTVEEETRFLEAINPPFYNGKSARCDFDKQNNWDLCILLLDLGCRYAEAANLTWSQVDLSTETVTVYRGKSRTGFKPATLHMTDRVKDVLTRRHEQLASDNQHVFPTKHNTDNEAKWVHRAVKAAKLNTANGSISLHTLRHTFAARMLHSGLNLVELKELLGHANIATTMIYAHLVPGDASKKAADVLNKIKR